MSYQNPGSAFCGADPEAADPSETASSCEGCGELTGRYDAGTSMWLCSEECAADVVAAGEEAKDHEGQLARAEANAHMVTRAAGRTCYCEECQP